MQNIIKLATENTLSPTAGDFDDALTGEFTDLAKAHNGDEISKRSFKKLLNEFDALLEIASFECLRQLVIEVGTMQFSDNGDGIDPESLFYVHQARWEGRDGITAGKGLPDDAADALRSMSNADGEIIHLFATSGDAVRFAGAVMMTFYLQIAESYGGEITA